MFAESKDEIALVLFGTSDTDNPLVDGDSYEHVTIARHLGVADFELLQMVQNDIQPGDTPADCILLLTSDHSSIQFKVVSVHSEKSIGTPPHLSEVSPTSPLKQFQCSSD